MKRQANWLMALLLILVVLAGCGGGGGAAGGNNNATTPVITNSDTTTTTPTITSPEPATPTVIASELPLIKSAGFPAFPESGYLKKIVWAVNESFALNHPEWEANAQKVIADFNAALARSWFINAHGEKEYLKTQLVIERFKTYKDDQLEQASKDSAYYFDNGYGGKIKGNTIFTFVYTDYAQIPNVSMRAGIRAGGGSYTTIDGKFYGRVFAAEPVTLSVLLGKATVDQAARSVGHFEQAEHIYFHESGHVILGLAADEWYNYVFTDKNGTLPNLGSYNRRTDFANDFMAMNALLTFDAPAPTITYQLAPANAFLAQKNAIQQYDFWEITQGVPAQIWLRVVDIQGNPISDARITLFGAAKNQMVSDGSNAVDMQVALGTFVSDVNGYVKMQTKDVWDTYANNLYIAWGIEAAAGGKYAGTILTVTDLELKYLQQEQDVYDIELKLQ